LPVLQLLHLAGEIADGFLEAVETRHDIARRVLCRAACVDIKHAKTSTNAGVERLIG